MTPAESVAYVNIMLAPAKKQLINSLTEINCHGKNSSFNTCKSGVLYL
jgi:hypothetical protein